MSDRSRRPRPPDALGHPGDPHTHAGEGMGAHQDGAFGLNNSELHTRVGLAEGVAFTLVLGIEAAGCPAPGRGVPSRPTSRHPYGRHGRRVRWWLRRVDLRARRPGDCVPEQPGMAHPGGRPEMLQTSNGSLTLGLDAQPGHSILIRGGTSSVGMATAVLAKQRDMTVLSTTRNPPKAAAMTAMCSSTTAMSPGRYGPSRQRESTPPSNWSAHRPCRRPGDRWCWSRDRRQAHWPGAASAAAELVQQHGPKDVRVEVATRAGARTAARTPCKNTAGVPTVRPSSPSTGRCRHRRRAGHPRTALSQGTGHARLRASDDPLGTPGLIWQRVGGSGTWPQLCRGDGPGSQVAQPGQASSAAVSGTISSVRR